MGLPQAPPRPYRLRDCYRGRVWRDPLSMIARDVLWVGLAMALAGLAYAEDAFIALGLVITAAALLGGALATLVGNLRRMRLIREAPVVDGTLGRAKRVIVLHEFFRGARERTYALPYTWRDAAGRDRRGTVWICGCARDRLVAGATTPIVHDDRRSLPLRLAVMTAPHR